MKPTDDLSIPSLDDRGAAFMIDMLASAVLALPAVAVVESLSSFGTLPTLAVVVVAWIGLTASVAAWMESGPWRATPGKLACGLRVAARHGSTVTFRRALLRNLVKLAVPLPITVAMVAIRHGRGALHDRVGGTVVVKQSVREDSDA